MCWPQCVKCKRKIPKYVLKLPESEWHCPHCKELWTKKDITGTPYKGETLK